MKAHPKVTFLELLVDTAEVHGTEWAITECLKGFEEWEVQFWVRALHKVQHSA